MARIEIQASVSQGKLEIAALTSPLTLLAIGTTTTATLRIAATSLWRRDNFNQLLVAYNAITV